MYTEVDGQIYIVNDIDKKTNKQFLLAQAVVMTENVDFHMRKKQTDKQVTD